MSKPHDPHVMALATDISRVIDRYIQEFDLHIATVIGVVEMIKLGLYEQVIILEDEVDLGEDTE